MEQNGGHFEHIMDYLLLFFQFKDTWHAFTEKTVDYRNLDIGHHKFNLRSSTGKTFCVIYECIGFVILIRRKHQTEPHLIIVKSYSISFDKFKIQVRHGITI